MKATERDLLRSKIIVLLADQAHGLPNIWASSWKARAPYVADKIIDAIPQVNSFTPMREALEELLFDKTVRMSVKQALKIKAALSKATEE